MELANHISGQCVAMNLSPKTDSLLATLGLNRLIDCYQVGSLSEELECQLADIMDLENLELDGQDKLSSLTTMLEAHQNLIDVSPEENLSRFKDVITYLEQDLKAL